MQWKSGGQSYNTSDRQETVSGGSTTTYTIENLTLGTTYTVRVIAILSGGMDSTPSDEVMGTPSGINYDSDGDGLIDIKTLAQLHAIRWDLNGDGAVDASASSSDTTAYNAAFPYRDTTSNVRMGCPSGTCTGYELLNNLDFDTDGSGSVTSDDTYPNWSPIGGTYSATFKGNNKTISNLHINQGSWNDVGLFSRVSGNISGLGLKNVNVRGRERVGGLVGNQVGGRILGCFVTGRVEGTRNSVGGLAGESSGNNTVIAASYANAVVSVGHIRAGAGGLVGKLSATVIASYAIGPASGHSRVGGLVGQLGISPSSVSTSYATGTVTGRYHDSSQLGGLIGHAQAGVSHSYWDKESSGRSSSARGTGQTTSALRSETDYNGIYANWNVDVDGRPGNDDPWTFGAADQYPVLKYAGMDTTAQFAMQPPGIPTSVTVTVQRDTLDVRWRAPSNATGYKVQWKAGAQNYDASRQTTVTGTRYKIANLIGGTTYTVRVIATKTGVRDGRPSAEQTGVPLMGSPTGVEVNAKVDTLTVTWNAVNGATGYKVQWKSGSETYPAADEESATHGQATIAGGSTTIHKISGLTPGTTYAIRVIATRTNVADSAPSEEVITLLTLGSPTGVEVSAKVDTLTVTWNAVPLATGYKVQWKSGAQTYPTSDLALATHGQATIAGGNTTIHKISGLTTGTTYAIRVIATHTTTAGNSAPSEEVMVTSATTRPTNVRVTPGPAQLIVAWTEATGATGYKVQWKSGGQSYNTSDRQATVSGMSTTTYTIENLTFGATYTVRVTATLAGGTDSDPSDEVMGTPQAINYDSDGDGLIDIKTLAQLHAIRWDLNGDGVVADNDTMTYNAAFPGRVTTSSGRMGCPSGTCTGYELLNNLDFDENGDGEITSADATYWDSGFGWLPIGTNAARYTGDFKGNGYTIDNLTINRPAVVEVGLFGNADTASRIESVGVTNASVAGGEYAGALVGALRGTVVACYSTGNVSVTTRTAGGLVGWTPNAITSSYSTASVSGPEHVGGLLGASQGGTVTNSYSIGMVTGTGSSPLIGGLIGSGTGGTASYWDTQTSGCTSGGSNGCTTSAGGGGVTGLTTSELISPTTYGATSNDTYYGWNANLDGQPGNDDPWTFGTTNQYPVLKYAGMDTTVQFQRQPAIVMLTLMPSSISESGGMSTVTATLTRSWSTATTITVRPVTGAYTVGMDSTITIAAGQTANASDTVVITAVDNTRDELNRDVTVSVVSANAQGSVVLPTAITITDDDPPPRLSISSPSAVEGTALTFTVRLNAESGKEVTVAYADAGTGSATSGTDYTALTAGTLTFAAGTTSQTIAVSVTDDGDDEPNETVIVTLSSATNATISTAQGTGTIIDDDGMPALSIGSPSVIEGATGATLTFQVYLRPAHTAQVTVAYADAGTGTATSGTDYTALTAGTLTFAMGDTIQTIPVSVTDDSDDEQNETVIVTLSSATNATISTAQGTGTIIDDESPSANLDVDGDGGVYLLSDMLLIIRHLLGFEEGTLTPGLVTPDARRRTYRELDAYIGTLTQRLDVDDDGGVYLLSDMLLIIRHLLGFEEGTLTPGLVTPDARRRTYRELDAYIDSLYPPSP